MIKTIKELVCIESESPQELTNVVNNLVGNRWIKGCHAQEIESVSVVFSDGLYRAFVLIVVEVEGSHD